ncbi:hypothetical protein [Actinoplanes xinjiangensis]|jgi:hypothetical protein|uniref:Lipoprotein n=1 Tax=Actinoplanes xinjiangensis TaxID=512350 RepID=A0A316EMD5_9ACTN|nr:hypothetical protein [Actinoplanes xinjiangensis]PWK33269.1 hypothetical protein BC793_12859 [Actinoplanes xinjiangensis]GIF43492.1 hypothetical protein Axi01nite_78030 [Actinoplanes xinjiangensis]
MRTPKSVRSVSTALVVHGLLLAGCSSPETYDYSAPAAAPTTTTARQVEEKTTVNQPPRPEGTVPRLVLGSWHGGQDNRTDYRFIATSKGQYQLEHKETPAIPAFVEKGWIVGDADEILLRPVLADGVRTQERTASWTRLPNSVGVDILVVSDPLFGELTYVPADR